MQKYKKMIQIPKTKTNNIVISDILPRTRVTVVFYDKAFSINYRPKALRSQESVKFINLGDDFYDQSDLFLGDGLHHSGIFSVRFGRLLNNKVFFFFRQNKNGAGPAPEASP